MNKENSNIKKYKKLGNFGMLIMSLGVILYMILPENPEILGMSVIIGVPSMLFADYKVFFRNNKSKI